MEKMNNKVGIVILNYNSYNLTQKLVNKIQDFSSIDEICVVDNNSKDNFDNMDWNNKVYYIKNNVNAGYSAGNNIGLKYLIENRNCEYVFIANPDVIFDNNSIQIMVDYLMKNEDIATISCKRFGHNNSIIHQYFDFPNIKTSIENCFFLPRRKFEKNRHYLQNKKVDECNGLLYVDAVPGSFFGIRKEFLIKNNYLCEEIFMYGEEIILGKQVKNLKYKSAITNNSTYIHDHIQKRFESLKMIKNDKKSLIHYFKMFGLINWYQNIALNIAVFLGTFEYSCAYYLYHFFNKEDRK